MPVPKPGKNEKEDAFISRCISTLHKTDPDRPDDQITAMCFNAWRESKKKGVGPRTEEERAKAHFKISDKDWEKLTEKEKQKYIDRLPPRGTAEYASLNFEAALHSIETGDEKNLATFYIMNTSPNRLGWGVTDKALEEALPTLLSKPIGCGPGYKIDEHYDNPIEVGKWVSTDKPNGYALATAEITDALVLKKLRSGEWGPISVVIDSYKESMPDNGAEMVESFVFTSVDFVDVPAFPQAGFMNFAGLEGEPIVTPLEFCASFYESQSNGRGPGSLGLDSKTRGTKKKMEQALTEVKKELETLTASYKKMTAEFKDLKEETDELKAGLEEKPEDKPEKAEEDPKIKELEATVKVMTDERHAERVAGALDARLKAGLVKDQKAEMERLGKLDDETLTILTLDAGIVTERLEKAVSLGPRASQIVSNEDKTEFAAALSAKREELGVEGLRERE